MAERHAHRRRHVTGCRLRGRRRAVRRTDPVHARASRLTASAASSRSRNTPCSSPSGVSPSLLMRSTPSRLSTNSGGRVGAEDEMVDPDRVERAASRRRVVAGRFEIHHLQVMQRLVLDQHRLVGAEEERLLLQPVGIVHAPDHLADAAAEMGADELELREISRTRRARSAARSQARRPSGGRRWRRADSRACAPRRSRPTADGSPPARRARCASWKNGIASSSSG